MLKLASIAILTLTMIGTAATFAPTSALAQACTAGPQCPHDKPGDDPGIPSDLFGGNGDEVHLLIACRVKGPAGVATDDLRFRNIGDATIPAGSRVAWQIKETGERGVYTLKLDLHVGDNVDEPDFLKKDAVPEDHCLSQLLPSRK